MKVNIFCLILFLLTVSLGYIEPNYSGYFDLRYTYSSLNNPASGTFRIDNAVIRIQLPLRKNYQIVYETQVTSNIESYSVLYFLYDQFLGLPWGFKFGRFRIPFALEQIQRPNRVFISDSIMKDIRWGNSYLIPREETGLSVFYRDPELSTDIYFVNGNGEYMESMNNHEGKSFGIDFRFPVRNVLWIGSSLYYNDTSDSVNFGSNNSYYLLSNDYKLIIFDIQSTLAVYITSGRLNGVSQDGNGIRFETILPLSTMANIGVHASLFNLNNVNYYRVMGVLSQRISNELTLSYELLYDKVKLKKNVQFQCQLLVVF